VNSCGSEMVLRTIQIRFLLLQINSGHFSLIQDESRPGSSINVKRLQVTSCDFMILGVLIT